MWKTLDKFSNYEISSLGDIRNIKTQRILKYGCSSKGYLRTTLRHEGNTVTVAAHRLVAETYIANPNNLPQVNHIDGNKLNNDVSNLEWISCRDNIIHSFNNGLAHNSKQSLKTCESRKLTVAIANNLRNDSINGMSAESLANKYGVSKASVYSCLRGDTY